MSEIHKGSGPNGSDEEGRPAEGGPDDASESVLRAKYRDYCSARVAHLLLSLTPDEIYVLADDEARRSGVGGPASYDEAVSFATKRVQEQLELPDFLAWQEEYRSDPARFDPILMGLWESEED